MYPKQLSYSKQLFHSANSAQYQWLFYRKSWISSFLNYWKKMYCHCNYKNINEYSFFLFIYFYLLPLFLPAHFQIFFSEDWLCSWEMKQHTWLIKVPKRFPRHPNPTLPVAVVGCFSSGWWDATSSPPSQQRLQPRASWTQQGKWGRRGGHVYGLFQQQQRLWLINTILC